jgi:hypothetical protein
MGFRRPVFSFSTTLLRLGVLNCHMTGHTSNEIIGDGTGHERGTDAESATKTSLGNRGGVVQDSPGSSNANVEHDNGGNGNLTGEQRPVQDDNDL